MDFLKEINRISLRESRGTLRGNQYMSRIPLQEINRNCGFHEFLLDFLDLPETPRNHQGNHALGMLWAPECARDP